MSQFFFPEPFDNKHRPHNCREKEPLKAKVGARGISSCAQRRACEVRKKILAPTLGWEGQYLQRGDHKDVTVSPESWNARGLN